MEIWEEIAADANTGAERLIAEYGDRLLTSASFLTGNAADAEDLVFRTFSRVVERISQYSRRSSFYTWIYSIMLNFRKMDLRRRGANALDFTDEPLEAEDPRPSPSESFLMAASADTVRAAVAELPEPLRAVVVLTYFEDMDVNCVSRVLGIAAGSVKSRLFRARRRLAWTIARTEAAERASKMAGGTSA